MMKHLYSILLLLFIFSPLGAKSRRVSVHTPGSLPTLIGERQKYKLTSLAVEGALNGTDLRFLREMAGSDYRLAAHRGAAAHARPQPGHLCARRYTIYI